MLTTSQLLRAANNKYLMQEFPQPKLLGTKNIHEIHHYEPVLFSNSSPQGRGTVRNMKLVLQSEQNLPLPCCTQATEISGVCFPLPTLKMHPQPALPPSHRGQEVQFAAVLYSKI